MRTRWKTCTALLNIICALALVMIGFAHRAPVNIPAEIQFAAYILPDGKLPTLCVTDDGSQPGKPHLPAPGCEACRLAGSVLLPEPPQVDVPTVTVAREAALLEREYLVKPTAASPGSRSRAPPLSVNHV